MAADGGATSPRIVVCSNRGPFAYHREGDGIIGRRGGGGVISAIASVLESTGGTWVAAALSDVDREVAAQGPRTEDHFVLRLVDVPHAVHANHYEVVSNQYLWFAFHYLFDETGAPDVGAVFTDAWGDYRAVNQHFADALGDAQADVVLVEDYHFLLLGRLLRDAGDTRPLSYFHHTPWCAPSTFATLPVAAEILQAMSAYDAVGFHAQRWADAFVDCCERFAVRPPNVFVAPVPLDVPRLRTEVADERTQVWVQRHTEERGDRTLLVRVDRTDLSKNPLRGFLAFERLLERRPALADEVLFLAQMYPSRQNVEAYQRYFAQCRDTVDRINERFGGPIDLHAEDDFHNSLAAMVLSDVLLVNPVWDGLNLVAKEGALANERDGSIVLSRNAGAYEQLADGVIAIDPFDVEATADALEQAIDRPHDQRAAAAGTLRDVVTRGTPLDWVTTRLSAAGVSR